MGVSQHFHQTLSSLEDLIASWCGNERVSLYKTWVMQELDGDLESR